MFLVAGLTVPPLIALYFLKLKRNVQVVPSTLLWRRAVEDLQVNSPIQRLRASLLFFLQLLLLLLGAFALGRPMRQAASEHKDALILLVDHSASMSVREADGRTRLEKAKEEAKRSLENLADGAQAMVIAFSDRATVVSSFDKDRRAVQQRIDSIEPTQSTSRLAEAVSLAEAYAQTIVIGGELAGTDVQPDSNAPPARVFVFTDGRIEDQDKVILEKLDSESMTIHTVGTRDDNVGILAMDARRDYDRPDLLEVAATIANFGSQPVTVDAVLLIEDRTVDVQTVQLAAAADADSPKSSATVRNVAAAAFDEIEFAGGGVIEVMLRIDDALAADDRSWSVIDEPRRTRVLLVTSGYSVLPAVFSAYPIDLEQMTGGEYESADDKVLREGRRSAFDVVVFDRYSTSRLPQGNYFFWGAAPKIDGVTDEGVVTDQIVFNWDETHPLLRHVAVETLVVQQWRRLKLPSEAVILIEGEDSPILSYFTRGPSQFLICAFGVVVEDDDGEPLWNSQWITTVDFVLFVQNALSFLSSEAPLINVTGARPGDPITLQLSDIVDEVSVIRPDGAADAVATGGNQTLNYGRTRHVGPYRVKAGKSREQVVAVNLFSANESRVAPSPSISIGGASLSAQSGSVQVNQPAWPHVLLAMLGVLLLEWIVYNRKVFV